MTKSVSGTLTGVACMSRHMCVLVGFNNNGQGDLIWVHDGVPSHPVVVPDTDDVYGVSCPGASGCVAIAASGSRSGADFVTIGRSGAIISSTWANAPVGVILREIWCAGLTSCVVGGGALTSRDVAEVGTWRTGTLTLHRVGPPRGMRGLVDAGLSCVRSSCELVGSGGGLSGYNGFVLPIRNGKPGAVREVRGYALTAVSCVSASRCYAVGYSNLRSVATIVNSGKPGTPRKITGDYLYSIACIDGACTAGGARNSGVGLAGPGQLITLSAGHVKRRTPVPHTQDFVSVARIGHFLAAVSSQQPARKSEVTTGTAPGA